MSGSVSLGEASGLAADLGGYRARNHAAPRGSQFMWKAYDMLTNAILGHRVRAPYGARHGSDE